MKILIDMNLSPDWVEVFIKEGWEAVHWSKIGDPRENDRVVMQWAYSHGYVVFTHDLDFGFLLATSHAKGPSVIQIRIQDIMPQSLGNRLVKILNQYKTMLEKGALIIIDDNKSRIRILPFQ